MGGFSAFAGCLALAVIVIPWWCAHRGHAAAGAQSLREAASALVCRARSSSSELPTPRAAGLITGVLLATARGGRQTAPLLFTALSNQFSASI